MVNAIFAKFAKNEIRNDVYGLWQWDYGQVLRIQGLDLPTAVEIHFSLQETGGEAVTRVGTTRDSVTNVVIPDSMLENSGAARNYSIYVFVYLADESSGETVRKIVLHVTARPKPEVHESPEEAELFREAIAAVNAAANRAEQAASVVSPTIGDNGNWYILGEDTRKPSRGENGADGTSGVPARQEMTVADTAVELQPNVLYVFPEMGELSLTLAQPTDTTIANEYRVIFRSGETPTVLMLPDAINVGNLKIEANKIYELSIMENLLLWQSWEVQNA